MGTGPDSLRIDRMLHALPMLPLRNSVLFPASVVPINVGRPRSVRLVQELLGQERSFVGVFSQREAAVSEPTFEDLYSIGTIARVVKVIRLGPANYSVVLNGLGRIRLLESGAREPFMRGRVERVKDQRSQGVELDALTATLRESTREVLALMPNLPRETAAILDQVRDPSALADLIAANMPPSQATVAQKQEVLEALESRQRVKRVLALVGPQLEELRKTEGEKPVPLEKTEEDRSAREEMLRQQMSNIREQLGEDEDEDELERLWHRVNMAKPPREALDAARKQLRRLKIMSPQSSEYNVTRNYVEWISDLPWSKTTGDDFDMDQVRRCLDEDHHGLAKVKKRIVEFAAVRQLRRDMKGPILLFVGPPGVGKTSLGRSIARATNRAYERIALGGVRDEAEIRGHRRTYVSALPGRIVRAMKKAGTRNPVLVLDEIEKMGADLRGDPGAALLEVLDPAQNSTFRDHYMDLPFDLSQVMFLATANSLRGISPPLLDRMEVIHVPGYTRGDKLAIAKDFLVPKQLVSHGITSEQLEFSHEGLERVVDAYTREAGVRNLERQIGALCRAAVVRLVAGNSDYAEVTPGYVEEVLGAAKHRPETVETTLRPGVATGLASTPNGGMLMFVEASKMPGKGRIRLTGNMRNVMKESAATAVSYVRSKSDLLHLDPEWIKHIDLHLHIPQHGTPKDGPSAGIAMFAAVASLILDCPLRPDIAMAGEISLRGRVLKVHDLAPKLLAAHHAGIRHVMIPERNKSDLADIPENIRAQLNIRLVASMDEVLPIALQAPSDDSVVAGATASAP
jgi:ATP-dependent Lon protease